MGCGVPHPSLRWWGWEDGGGRRESECAAAATDTAADLSALTATSGNDRAYPARDAIDQASCRPDFCALIYPAYLFKDDKNSDLANALVKQWQLKREARRGASADSSVGDATRTESVEPAPIT